MTDPRARVLAFIEDWHAEWASVARATGWKGFDFDGWRARVHELDGRHFVRGAGCGSENSFSPTAPAHVPRKEAIAAEHLDGDHARIETVVAGGFCSASYEYELVRAGDEWRIAKLLLFLDPPGAPLVPEADRAAILAAAHPDAALAPLPQGVALDGAALFEDGRTVTKGDRTSTLSVRRVGTLCTRSGILGVRDFGYDMEGLRPLARSVAPGAYPVDVVEAFGRNAAVRVRIDERAEVVAWHPADTAGGGHVIGVDAGNIAIFDVASLVGIEARARERIFLEYADRGDDDVRPRASLFALGSEAHEGVVLDSGFGDGAYPCYWGLDAHGSVVTLLVDFLVLAE